MKLTKLQMKIWDNVSAFVFRGSFLHFSENTEILYFHNGIWPSGEIAKNIFQKKNVFEKVINLKLTERH